MKINVRRVYGGSYEIKLDLDQLKYESGLLDQGEMDDITIGLISELLYYDSDKVLKFLKDEYNLK